MHLIDRETLLKKTSFKSLFLVCLVGYVSNENGSSCTAIQRSDRKQVLFMRCFRSFVTIMSTKVMIEDILVGLLISRMLPKLNIRSLNISV